MGVSAPSNRDLLLAWEREAERSAPQRGLELLTMASGVAPDPRGTTIGSRDTHLLELRAATFGDELVGLARCPVCRRDLELTLSARELIAATAPAEEGTVSSTFDGYQVSARRPTVADLTAATERATDVQDARSRLLGMIILEASHDGRPASIGELPAQLLDDLEERLGAADSLADTRFALRCPDCSAEWEEPFDVADFFWTETNAWAARMLEDVHQLASAYGWQEHAILDLGERRRRIYLELVNG
jgi:hypothetical protein